MTITQGTKINDGTAQFITTDITDGIPVGDVVYRPYLKDGYLACNGQTVNRSDYSRLVALADKYNLWTTDQNSEPWKFGQGDGNTTMTMPNYLERVVWGGNAAGKREAGLPNITGGELKAVNAWWGEYPEGVAPSKGHKVWNGASGISIENIARRTGPDEATPGENQNYYGSYIGFFDASRSNAIYGNSSTVQPPAIVLIPQMKY